MQNSTAIVTDLHMTLANSKSHEHFKKGATEVYEDARRFLRKYSRLYPIFLVSRTPQKMLDEMVRDLGIEPYISNSYGTTRERTKENYVDVKFDPYSRLYMFGDMPEDIRMFRRTGMASQVRVPIAVVRKDSPYRPVRFIQAGLDEEHIVSSFDEADQRIEKELAQLSLQKSF